MKEYKNWTFNVGGGASLTNGQTAQFVRGGGGIVAAGVARNYSKYFGLRFDFPVGQFASAHLGSATGAGAERDQPCLFFPVRSHHQHSGHESVERLHCGRRRLFSSIRKAGSSSTAIPGSACNPFFTWWGNCFNSSLPVNKGFLSTSQNQWGENFGGGVARKIRPNIEIYGEFRYLHGTHSGITTDLRPITVGVRW